ncbi:MAG: class II fumarate hydratase [Spirochaetales bacterium]|nr:MAG: class II fumarate hydratase [Spirochaetales bacterium]
MGYRTEKDTMGEVEVEESRYWGSQTQRALLHFPQTGEKFPGIFLKALGMVKKAACMANRDCKLLPPDLADVILRAADEVISGKMDEHLPLSVWQSGSGTQTNMNINEVIANRSIELLNGVRGSKSPVHPNDHVNMSQSTNDVFPTAMHVAAVEYLHTSLLPVLEQTGLLLRQKEREYADIIKSGRTHLQDAAPLTLGQEFSGYAHQTEENLRRLRAAGGDLMPVPLGGTAVGTGLNAHPEFAVRAVACLAEITGLPFVCTGNKFALMAGHDSLVQLSGSLNTLACSLVKIANDIRWMGSGPRCGLGELLLPENEPGSSIMPGKINPTQSEVLLMVCAQVTGNHTAVSMAGAGGNFELNVYKPLIIYNILQSMRILAESIKGFNEFCLQGLAPRRDVIERHLRNNLMLVTALNTRVGYDNAAKIARTAFMDDCSLKEAALKLGLITDADFDRLTDPRKMTGPPA